MRGRRRSARGALPLVDATGGQVLSMHFSRRGVSRRGVSRRGAYDSCAAVPWGAMLMMM